MYREVLIMVHDPSDRPPVVRLVVDASQVQTSQIVVLFLCCRKRIDR